MQSNGEGELGGEGGIDKGCGELPKDEASTVYKVMVFRPRERREQCPSFLHAKTSAEEQASLNQMQATQAPTSRQLESHT